MLLVNGCYNFYRPCKVCKYQPRGLTKVSAVAVEHARNSLTHFRHMNMSMSATTSS